MRERAAVRRLQKRTVFQETPELERRFDKPSERNGLSEESTKGILCEEFAEENGLSYDRRRERRSNDNPKKGRFGKLTIKKAYLKIAEEKSLSDDPRIERPFKRLQRPLERLAEKNGVLNDHRSEWPFERQLAVLRV